MVIAAVFLLALAALFLQGSQSTGRCAVSADTDHQSKYAWNTTSDLRSLPQSMVCPSTENPHRQHTNGWPIFLSALERYKDLHRNGLYKLRNSANVRTLAWVCSQKRCSGLGDQLLRIQFFFLLAMMSDRVFAIYWDEDLRRSTQYLTPNAIDYTFRKLGIPLPDDCSGKVYGPSSIFGFGWTKEEFREFGEVLFSSQQHIAVTGQVFVNTMFIGDDSILDPGELITKGFVTLGIKDILAEDRDNGVFYEYKALWYAVMHMLGLHHVAEIPETDKGRILVTSPWLHLSHTIFCYLFRFPQQLLSQVSRVEESLGMSDRKYIAVHLRTGFQGTPFEENFLTCLMHKNWKIFDNKEVWSCIMNHTLQLAEKLIGPDYLIYLATDSELVKEWAINTYGTYRIKTAKLIPFHSGRQRRSHHHGIESKYADDNVSMWVDFFLLGKAEVMVHGDSSFAVTAGFLYPTAHSKQSWISFDTNMECITSRIAKNVTCICHPQS